MFNVLRLAEGWGSRAAMMVVFLLFSVGGARADSYDITFINVTFSATCIGGGTCTEVVNGSGLYDSVTMTASNLSIALTGTLNASLDVYGTPHCVAQGCFGGSLLSDSGALPGYDPIEFSPSLPTFTAPTPIPLEGGPNGTELFVPGACGGDQADCNEPGAFPGGPNADYEMVSGTYTSVDLTTNPVPEPATSALALSLCGLGALARRWRRRS